MACLVQYSCTIGLYRYQPYRPATVHYIVYSTAVLNLVQLYEYGSLSAPGPCRIRRVYGAARFGQIEQSRLLEYLGMDSYLAKFSTNLVLEVPYPGACVVYTHPRSSLGVQMHDAQCFVKTLYFPLSRKFIEIRIYRRGLRRNFIKHCRRDLQIG